MEKQLIISVSREFGSGGYAVAEELAGRFKIGFYDHNILDLIAQKKSGNADTLKKFDEVPKSRLFSRTVRGFSNSPEDVISEMQFDFMREKAEAGESFVIVGRCSEAVLKGHPGLVTVFILGDYDKKVERVCEKYHLSQSEAQSLIKTKDKKRKSYHNYHCDLHWGDSRGYDISINSSKLGVSGTADVIEAYIRERFGIVYSGDISAE
ncbi:MAG: cytidylate kinase-like family protein [Clostridiales bacterium]|nr:cytidylate kinase-like family protein [Clostridiales bacterium]